MQAKQGVSSSVAAVQLFHDAEAHAWHLPLAP